jgi:hypothetical protein
MSDRYQPYLEGEWGSEKEDHVRLKNQAVMFLMSQGFKRDDITEECRKYGNPIDVYAEEGDIEIGVECETGKTKTSGAVSYTSDFLRTGHRYFLINPSGIYLMVGRGRVYDYHPVNQVQLQFGNAPKTPVGRWFSNGRSANSFDVHPHLRWSSVNDRSRRHLAYGYSYWVLPASFVVDDDTVRQNLRK